MLVAFLTPYKDVKEKDKTWESIRDSFSYTSQWKNSGNPSVNSSMANQYYCHYDFAFTGLAGSTWDLKLGTADKGYAGFVANGCN